MRPLKLIVPLLLGITLTPAAADAATISAGYDDHDKQWYYNLDAAPDTTSPFPAPDPIHTNKWKFSETASGELIIDREAGDDEPFTPGDGCWTVTAAQVHCQGATNTSRSIDMQPHGGDDVIDVSALPGHDYPEYADGKDQTFTYLGAGNDTYVGWDRFDEVLDGAGADNISLGASYDRLTTSDTKDAGDVFDGGAGDDEINYGSRSAAMTFTLDDAAANDGESGEADTVTNFETLATGSGNDTITGNAADNAIHAGSGSDTINGLGGDDLLSGGRGNDTVNGGAGDENILGDEGNDTLDGGPGADSIDGWTGNDIITARDGEPDRIACDPSNDGDPQSPFDSATADTRDYYRMGCETFALPSGVVEPSTTVTSGPEKYRNVKSEPTFTFASDTPGGHFECRLSSTGEWPDADAVIVWDDSAWKPCDGGDISALIEEDPYDPSWNPFTNEDQEDYWTLNVRAWNPNSANGFNDADQTPATYGWKQDTSARPWFWGYEAPGAGTTDLTTTSREARLHWGVYNADREEVASFDCQLDDGPWTPCSSDEDEPTVYTNLSDGKHTARARISDMAGNVGVDQWTWTVLGSNTGAGSNGGAGTGTGTGSQTGTGGGDTSHDGGGKNAEGGGGKHKPQPGFPALLVPKGGKVKIVKATVKLTVACKHADGCSAVKLKLAYKNVAAQAKLPALAHGKKTTVAFKLTAKAQAAVNKTRSKGLAVTITGPKGFTKIRLKLVR
jgi:hypothetical protein